MAPLAIDSIATAGLAACLGLAGPKALKPAMGLCISIALLGWAASYVIMALSPSFGGDTALAEYYINGFSARNAAIEIAGALTWAFLWFSLVRVTLLVIRLGRKRVT